ncbi:MAG: hypothetical protein JRJ45_00475 [Deltaproteobacteria bacterium]|nr:hypothetical protein [Deltaproteobacteria bacterium]
MSNYTPTPLSDADEHLRYGHCTLVRPYGDDAGQPRIVFREEHIIEDAKGKQVEHQGELTSAISDDNEETEFDIINPGTLEPTGKVMTYAALLQGIDSLYYHLAIERDAAAVEPPPGP